jgi:hypothetical protein
LIAAKLITASADIVLAMILTTAVPLIVYGSLIGAMRAQAPISGPRRKAR